MNSQLPPSKKLTLSIVGAGKVGRVLGQQFVLHKVFTLQDVVNRSLASSAAACRFIGAGQALSDMDKMRPADVLMLAVSDDQITACSLALQQRGIIHASSIVFHCSGALCASELALPGINGNTSGASAASLHPVRSFADPEYVTTHFAGTICSLEGDTRATVILNHALHTIGAEVVPLQANGKALYHAAAVFASNYAVTLMDAALTTYEAAGISPDMARRMAEPLAQETLSNVFRLGTKQALTGPIARGDLITVARHQDALNNSNKSNAALYQALTGATQNMLLRVNKKQA